MKKLLLATIITSTSFGAAATDSTNPPLEDGLNPILIVNPIDPGFGVDPIEDFIPGQPADGDLPPIDDVVVDPIDPGFGVDPIDPGFGVDPIEDFIPGQPADGDLPPIGDVVVDPIDPGFGVSPIIPTVDEKIEFINGHIANIGEGDASIVRDKNGNVQLTFTDQVSGETRQVNMSELTDDQVAVITTEARKYYDENKNGVNPITPTVDEKIAMVNQKFTDLGLTAHVTESANGQSFLVYGDGESILLNDLNDEGIADIKERATKAIKDDQIETPITPIDPGFGVDPIDVVIDPIDGEKPVPSEGQNIVEGINEKVAELKETYTGEKGKSAKDITTEKLSAIYKTQAQTDSRQDTAISTNAAGIKENKEAITFLNTEIDRLDNKMDGVMAGVHAVNNARPYLTAEGQTAVGAGVGFAGSNSAVAVGLAHAVSASWSVSATMNVTTGDESELSGGFGTQYTF
ncbi:hypothetical protein GLP37_15565 [Photobacterium phosphoreum]|uniref:YadA C-terminal domain-containing protein n=1 Tax=Photobacterium phosphoreum TaxID=659 RepID=UPI001E39E813|nr:YadA C-terminal domain-containing protein [Photobacterium phosphoreum]MCD9503598.1 hypothetical protein [Photobacterium phosphoreum]